MKLKRPPKQVKLNILKNQDETFETVAMQINVASLNRKINQMKSNNWKS